MFKMHLDTIPNLIPNNLEPRDLKKFLYPACRRSSALLKGSHHGTVLKGICSNLSFSRHFYFEVAQLVRTPAHAGDVRDTGLIRGLGRSPGGNGNPSRMYCLENSISREASGGHSPLGLKGADGLSARAGMHIVHLSRLQSRWPSS